MAEESDPLRLAREIAQAHRGPGQTRSRRRNRPDDAAEDRGVREDGAPVAGFLDQLVSQQGWNSSLAATRVFSQWETIVGAQVAQHTRVEHFADGIVHIVASSTAWAKELTMLAPQIVAKLNATLGDGLVQRIQVRGPQAPSWSSGPRAVKGRGPRDTYG